MNETITVKGLDDDEQAILTVLLKQLDAKAERNLLRAAYYDGKRAIHQVGSIIPPQYYRLGLVLGWSAKAVDALADRCDLKRFTWANGDLDSIGYDELWESNQLGIELSSGITSSLIHSAAFLITTKGGPGEPAALIHAKDATNATGLWNNRVRRLDALLSILGRDDKGAPTSLALYLDGETVTCDADGGWLVVDRQEHPWGVPAEPLVFKPRTGRPFGSSRISRPVMSLHDAALREMVRLEGHMDVYSFPQLWLLGADDSLFKNPDGSIKPVWQTMLGRIKALPDDDDAMVPRAEVKQVSASSPEPHLAQINFLAKSFARENALPDSSFALTDYANPTAADAINEGSADLIALAQKATDDWWGPSLSRAVARALAIMNGYDEVPAEWQGRAGLKPKWRNPVHPSRAAEADAGSKLLSSIPWLADTEVGLELAGLTDDQITRALAERRRLGGSAALRAITEAAQAGQPLVTSGDPTAS